VNAEGAGGIVMRTTKHGIFTRLPFVLGLAKNNGGQFPTDGVRRMIAGDKVSTSHGSREMPIGGPIFHQIEWDQDLGNVRLENLVRYLASIQQK
jgi:hypothetical protein